MNLQQIVQMQGRSLLPRWQPASAHTVRSRPSLHRSRVCAQARPAETLTAESPSQTSEQPFITSWDGQEGRALAVALPFPQPVEGYGPPVIHPEQQAEQAEWHKQRQQQHRPSILRRLWRGYVRLLDEKPILVKSATSFVGFLLGDLIAQAATSSAYDLIRTVRLVLFGMLLDGPIGHVWYTTLDKHVIPHAPKSNRAVVAKMLADQLLWAPFFSCCFFAFTNALAGQPQAIIPAIQAKLLTMMLANFAVWPVAHLLNFKFIPSQQRILYINCVQIAWSAYLSNLSSSRLRVAAH